MTFGIATVAVPLWSAIWVFTNRLLNLGIAYPFLSNDGNTTAALAAMTGICGFLWTGVLVLKQLGVRYDNRLRIAGEFLGYGFLAPLAAMVVNGNPLALRTIGLSFFIVYATFFVIHNIVQCFNPIPHDRSEQGVYTIGQAVYVLATVALITLPYSLTILVASFVVLFMAYQRILTKLSARTEEHDRTFHLVLFAEMLPRTGAVHTPRAETRSL